ncbi:MAG: helix-turn-helix domain-containing protein [Bacteroidetes bacterium]|nr:helix-turn-helix domain-containing protein [Bacteroidota bacterium]MBS1975960.1 helix-turn-helix domain-containing protein [Bacteroidota bacterium]
MNNRADLKLTGAEKKILRAHHVRQSILHNFGVDTVQQMLSVSRMRAAELCAMSEFQSLPNVGPRFAEDLIFMGFYSLRDLKHENGAKLTDRYEKQAGVWADPCVEDMFRMVVHYARHPGVHRNWWDFTAERKQFRAKHGYPEDRPGKPWHELPQFRTTNKVSGKKDETKMDVSSKVKSAAKYIREHYPESISLKKISREVGLSAFHLLRQFHLLYEMTPGQYQTHQRLKKATYLLRRSQRPVHSIAQACGFMNESAFIRTFRRDLKITPLQYRLKHKQLSNKRTTSGSVVKNKVVKYRS